MSPKTMTALRPSADPETELPTNYEVSESPSLPLLTCVERLHEWSRQALESLASMRSTTSKSDSPGSETSATTPAAP